MAVADERTGGIEHAAGPHMRDLIEARISRRTALAGGMAAVAGSLSRGIGAPPAVAAGDGKTTAQAAGLLGFDPIPLSFADEVVVPAGYTARPFIPWGTPILGATTMPPVSEWTLEMVRKSQNAHGVAVVEVERGSDGAWRVVRSELNRRITANTPMTASGPAAGHRLLRTAADPSGLEPLGTINNCANGHTPWGTYLTCEENFHGYFRLEAGAYDAEHASLNSAYGLGGDRNNWATRDPRFVVTPQDPDEPNRFGWVVEIDPDGRVWIQTDGSQPAGANDQMLAANPYVTDANGAPELRRFFTGVRGCEVTGIACTPDQRTMFVNIQHPGESLGSTWPQDDGFTTPRPATVVIRRTTAGSSVRRGPPIRAAVVPRAAGRGASGYVNRGH